MSEGRPTSKGRLGRVDLLRFIAAIAVVFFHVCAVPVVNGVADPTTFGHLGRVARYGYLGVELFFLISGFVIVMSASGRTIRGFLAHRALRLYPSFWAALALTLIVVACLPGASDLPTPSVILANITMLPGLFGSARVDDVYWTLAVEMKFYAVVAVLMLFRFESRVEPIVYAWLTLLAVQELGLENRVMRSITIFPHGAFFATGALTYIVFSKGWTPWRRLAMVGAWMLADRSAIRGMSEFMREPAPLDRLVVHVVILAVVGALVWATVLQPTKRTPALWVTLGAFTYPVYLTHGRIGRELFSVLQHYIPIWATVLVELSGVALLAWVLVAFVERRAIPLIARSNWFHRLEGVANRG